MKKKGILLYASSNESWIGGLYYIKNIAYSLSLNSYINENYVVYILIKKDERGIFSVLPNNVHILVRNNENLISKFLGVAKLLVTNNIKYIYPFNKRYNLLGVKGIGWIVDFQHKRMPDMFEQKEIIRRDNEIAAMIKANRPIVVSSRESYKDFFDYFNPIKEKVFILPFVSYIEKELNKITSEKEKEILIKYELYNKKYVCIVNQFWKHKNHIIVFEAIKKLIEEKEIGNVKFVCTGNLNDNRNPDYGKIIDKYLNNDMLVGKIICLGFLDRIEQLILMKNSDFIIQPSLFEGWGTVLEECKVLDKTVLLSNIPVHKEQKSNKCILFDPYNSDELKILVEKELIKQHNSNIDEGLEQMRREAKTYGKNFESIVRSI